MGPSRVRLEDGLILRDLAVKHFRLDGGTGQLCDRRLLILQTLDGSGAYSKMLDATMGVQMAYATHWGYSNLRWDGVVRGWAGLAGHAQPHLHPARALPEAQVPVGAIHGPR
jgi:hypothetical protein